MKIYAWIFFCCILTVSCIGHNQNHIIRIANDEQLAQVLVDISDGNSSTIMYNSVLDYYVSNAKYRECYDYAKYVSHIDSIDTYTSAYASFYMALSCIFLEMYDDAENSIWHTLALIEEHDLDDEVLIGMTNELAGIFTLKKESNYAKALNYFNQSYESFEKTGDKLNMCINLINMTELYILRKDTAGISYAKKAHELAKNTYHECITASKLSLIYSMMDNDSLALHYADTAICKMKTTNLKKGSYTYIYLSSAEVLFKYGDITKAQHFMKEAEKYIGYADYRTIIRYYAFLGDCHKSVGNYDEALRIYLMAEQASIDYGNREFNHLIYKGLADTYRKVGDSANAMEYYIMFIDAHDLVINFDNEQKMQELQLKYEKDNANLRIEKEKSKNIFLFTIIFIISAISVYIWVLYKKQQNLYYNIVSKYNDFRQSIEKVKEVEELRKDVQMSAMSGMFDRLEKMMHEDKIYRKSDLNIQSISECLGSNTTYVSNMINKFSGKTFPNYVNSYRIQEVVGTLSEQDNDMSIKEVFGRVGFYSMSTAYRVFQKEVGCSPNKFREQIRKLS